MDNETKTIDMTCITDATSYTCLVDTAIRSGTASNLGDSCVHSFTSVVDSAIKSGTASSLETTLVHSFASLVDTAIKSDTAPSLGTFHVHSFASRVRRDQLSHSMTRHNVDSGSGGDDDHDDDDEDDDDDNEDDEDEDDFSDIDKSKSSPSGRDTNKEPPKDGPPAQLPAHEFKFRELAAATKNFRPECLLGEGGFGCVYKGRLESTGQVVAIKQLDRSGGQGNRQFLMEILMLSILHHPNLVDMIGYCADGDQRLLVYQFMPLGSLEDHLHDIPPDQEPLDWNTRIKIVSGAAKGLKYLHEKANPPVIHRDLKSSNILLDEGYHPKLSDLGLAKLGPVGDKTHVSTRVMGTYGYCAPEYARTGKLSLKSDVYSFGVVLLELITGRKAIDNTRPHGEHNLVAWARPLFKDRRKFHKMADPMLQGRYPIQGLYQALTVAAMCLQEQPATRPHIQDVVVALRYLASKTYDPNATNESKRVGPSTQRSLGLSGPDHFEITPALSQQAQAQQDHRASPPHNTVNLQQPLLQTEETVNAVTPPLLPVNTDTKNESSVPKDGPTAHMPIAAQFTFRELAVATKNFRPEYLIGEGGFKRVYKGRLESTGQVVAIKQLDRNLLQRNREFLVEILMLSLSRHPNLVNLIGYCPDGDQRLIVYEYMPLGSLDHHLHDLSPDREPLDWNTRLKIAAGAAKGLEYLHDNANPPAIYRNFKPTNILLDEGYHPKLSDFALAKFGPVVDKTQVSTQVMGTYGYIAPEYAMSGQLSLESDVYSFGVVLLEIITGRKAIDNTRALGEQSLVAWARPLFKDRRKFHKMADPMLQGRYPIQGLYQALAVAAMCLQEQPATRPHIQDVVVALRYLASQTYDPNATNESKRVGPSTQRSTDSPNHGRLGSPTNHLP